MTVWQPPEPTSDNGPPDHAAWARLRWHDLVQALREEGLGPDEARRAAAAGLEALRPDWRRLAAEADLDVATWQECRRAAGLAPQPGAVAPTVGRPRDEPPDAADRPDRWLAEARGVDRRRAGRALVLLLGALVVVAGLLAWWGSRPEPPAVREAEQVLPVPWHDGAELHVGGVAVDLPDVDAFARAPDGSVLAREPGGPTWRIGTDGQVTRDDDASLPDRTVPVPEGLMVAPGDRVVESVAGPDDTTFHVVDSRAIPEGGFTRQSETGRRTVVACTSTDGRSEPNPPPRECSPWAVPSTSQQLRLR